MRMLSSTPPLAALGVALLVLGFAGCSDSSSGGDALTRCADDDECQMGERCTPAGLCAPLGRDASTFGPDGQTSEADARAAPTPDARPGASDAAGFDAAVDLDAAATPDAGAGACGLYGLPCCAGGPGCQEGVCLEGFCAAFGGLYGLKDEGGLEPTCRGNPLLGGACACPPGFVDQRLDPADHTTDEGEGLVQEIHVCTAPGDIPAADFRGAWSTVDDPAGFGDCGNQCTPVGIAGPCACPEGSEAIRFDGYRFGVGGIDCGRTLEFCEGPRAAPLTWGGAFYRYAPVSPACMAIPEAERCLPNARTGDCSCPDGYDERALRLMAPLPGSAPADLAACEGWATFCMRPPPPDGPGPRIEPKDAGAPPEDAALVVVDAAPPADAAVDAMPPPVDAMLPPPVDAMLPPPVDAMLPPPVDAMLPPPVDAEVIDCGELGEICCPRGDPCLEGACLDDTCVGFGGVYAIRRDDSDSFCEGNTLNGGLCECPGDFVEQRLDDMDWSSDEGVGYRQGFRFCLPPEDTPGADLRGIWSRQEPAEAASDCPAGCTANGLLNVCGCPAGTASQNYYGAHIVSGASDCDRPWSMCYDPVAQRRTWGGSFYEYARQRWWCEDIPDNQVCEPNPVTGACTCPPGFVEQPHTVYNKHPNRRNDDFFFCRGNITFCVRPPP